jgi:SAM-dependent methyltransferase
MTPAERWLSATWPLVQQRLPAPPATVLDVGCGSVGGFVPMLVGAGYDAVGIDPKAPDEARYQQVEFEHADLPAEVDAVMASTSLHHVANPAMVIDGMVAALAPGGIVVVVEWASEKFDEQTARWCFGHLGDEEGWLHELRDEWRASALEWPTYFDGWLEREGLHSGERLVRLLEERLERRLLAEGPYYFADLADVTEAEEQAAIDTGQVQAGRIDYVGTRPRRAHA